MFGDQRVELLHRDRAPFTGGLPLGRAVRAGVVPIHSPALRGAGAQRHAAATSCTDCQASEQDRPCRDARRLCSWTAGMQLSLHLLERVGLDNGRDRDLDDFVVGFSLARS